MNQNFCEHILPYLKVVQLLYPKLTQLNFKSRKKINGMSQILSCTKETPDISVKPWLSSSEWLDHLSGLRVNDDERPRWVLVYSSSTHAIDPKQNMFLDIYQCEYGGL